MTATVVRLWRPAGLALGIVAPFAAVLTYLALTTPPRPRPAVQAAAAAALAVMPQGHSPADLDQMLADLRTRLARTPQDVDGWVLLGRTLAANNRWQEATDAFSRAVAQRPDDPTLHLQLGEVLTLAAGGHVTPTAAAQFAYAPDDPRARYYSAVALAQAGDAGAARQQLQALMADAPVDAPWLELVRHELLTLDPIPALPPARGPTAVPLNDAAVRHLQARVAANPADAESWLALARADQDAGNRQGALAVLAQANARIAGNLDLLLAYGQMLADGIRDDALPVAFVSVMHRVQSVDPDQPDALWYLGLDAAARGDDAVAAANWRRLQTLLPPGSDEQDAVRKRLAALPAQR